MKLHLQIQISKLFNQFLLFNHQS